MYYQKYNCHFSGIYLESDGEYLTGLWFENSKDGSKHSKNLLMKDLPIFEEPKKWLDIYFEGKTPSFTPKYKIYNLMPFRKKVIDIMLTIFYGKVITYNDIAKKIAKMDNISKMSSQAVGGAVGWNPICIIIPCHRVAGQNGNLTGYGGLNNKVKLLELEKNDMTKFKMPKNYKKDWLLNN